MVEAEKMRAHIDHMEQHGVVRRSSSLKVGHCSQALIVWHLANLIALDNSEAAHGKLLPHEVCFVTQRAVLPGEQLCFYYGPEYSFAEEGISARALDAAAARTLPREQQEPGAAHGGLSLWVLERTSARSCRY